MLASSAPPDSYVRSRVAYQLNPIVRCSTLGGTTLDERKKPTKLEVLLAARRSRLASRLAPFPPVQNWFSRIFFLRFFAASSRHACHFQIFLPSNVPAKQH
jgi:hypothetical protein